MTDADGAVIDNGTVAKAAEPPADAITCTYGEEVIEDGETFTFVRPPS